MSKTLKELQASLAALDAEIAAARKAESVSALKRVHELVNEFSFTQQQLFPLNASKKKSEPKYRDEESGATWVGIGKPPAWIAGKNRDDFLIERPRADNGPYLAEMAAAAMLIRHH